MAAKFKLVPAGTFELPILITTVGQDEPTELKFTFKRMPLTELKEKQEKLRIGQTAYHRESSRLESLKNITERYDGYGNSIRKVMSNKEREKGLIGVVADIIKVDKTFIDDIVEDDYAQAFIKLIVDLSKTIGTKIVVEGVEHKEQFELLKSLGVDYIQGYYFGKPVPANIFEEKNLEGRLGE